MGNCCACKPKSNEDTEKVPESGTEEVMVEKKESEINIETNNIEENFTYTENKPLGTLLKEKVEEAPKAEEVKAEPKPEGSKAHVVKIQEEKPKAYAEKPGA